MNDIILGIDLAGSPKRDSGVAVISGKRFFHVGIAYKDEEILRIVRTFQPKIVAIDAPLTLPNGRKSIEQKNGIHFRECDLHLRKLGIKFFPITIGPMRMLTKRGMALKRKILKTLKCRVIEVFPGASYDIFGIRRKSRAGIVGFFRKKKFAFEKREYTQDELDGMCCAFTGKLVLEKKAKKLNGIDGCIWIPI